MFTPHKTNEAARCPYCGKKHNATTSTTGDHLPKPGDITICIECANVLLFNDDLTTRKPTDNELEEIMHFPFVVEAILSVKSLHNETNNN